MSELSFLLAISPAVLNSLGIVLTLFSVVAIFIGEYILIRFVYKTGFAFSKSDFNGSKFSKIQSVLRLISVIFSNLTFYTFFSVISVSPSSSISDEAVTNTSEFSFPWAFLIITAGIMVVSAALWFLGKGSFSDGIFHCCALLTSLFIYAEISNFLTGFTNLVDTPVFPFVARLAAGLVPLLIFIPLTRASAAEDQESWHKETALLIFAVNVFVHLTAFSVGAVLVHSDAEGAQYFLSLMMLSAAAVNALSICLGVILAKDRYFKRMTRINNEMISAQASHYEAVKQSNFEIRRVKHDMKNHLLVIEELAKAKNYDELLSYTSELNRQISSADLFYRTGNDIADAILSDKNNKASLRGIILKVSGDLYGCTLNPADLCTVIGNLLDNAIEAVGGFYGLDTDDETRTIVFEMRKNNNFLLLTETNYSPEPIIRKGDKIVSSKNSDDHGFGIYNIKNVVAKYDGEFEIIPENIDDSARSHFYKYRFEIMLPMKG